MILQCPPRSERWSRWSRWSQRSQEARDRCAVTPRRPDVPTRPSFLAAPLNLCYDQRGSFQGGYMVHRLHCSTVAFALLTVMVAGTSRAQNPVTQEGISTSGTM